MCARLPNIYAGKIDTNVRAFVSLFHANSWYAGDINTVLPEMIR